MGSKFVYRYSFSNTGCENRESFDKRFTVDPPIEPGVSISELAVEVIQYRLHAVLVAGPYWSIDSQVQLGACPATSVRASGGRPLSYFQRQHLEAAFYLPTQPNPAIRLVSDQDLTVEHPGYSHRNRVAQSPTSERISLEFTIRASAQPHVRLGLLAHILKEIPFLNPDQGESEWLSRVSLHVPPLEMGQRLLRYSAEDSRTVQDDAEKRRITLR